MSTELRSLLALPALEVAPLLLGAELSHATAEGTITVRITEVEAYLGEVDPGSHAFRGRTKRTEVMFGEPGHLYTYFTYGMHVCANVVCSPAGAASAVLIRAGEVVEGHDLARHRRHTSKVPADLARGPARLVVALGISLADGGADLLGGGPLRLELPASPEFDHSSGPRTGVSGDGGTDAFPWRFWITGDPTVSPYKKSAPKKRAAPPAG
ncbi:DNA-3-methyladenine glycosylase [soil metagenome]